MPRAPKTAIVRLAAILDISEELVRAAARLTPNPRLGASVLALALGRVCALPGIDLDRMLSLVRVSRESGREGLGQFLTRGPDGEERMKPWV
jgi:hypothetical protein